MYANTITELIGNTPLVKLRGASETSQALVLGKCEFLNPTHSVKDRIGLNMIKTALENGQITKDSVIIEPTSGNTGIGLASVCASLGLKLILTMPSSMSIERRKLLAALGAELVLTEPTLGMRGAVEKAQELSQSIPNAFVPQQFANVNNPAIHYATTAEEIWRDTNGKVDIFIAAVGTGGTITGTGKRLKELNPNIKIIAAEPDASPVLSGGKAGPHKIQGIGAGFIPKNYDGSVVDEILPVSNDNAILTSRQLAQQEGLLVGISSGAAAYAATVLAQRPENKGKNIVALLPDTGERYLSTLLYAFEEYPL